MTPGHDADVWWETMCSLDAEALHWLAGEVGDEVEVLVEMEHGALIELGHCGDQQVGDGGSAVLAALGQEALHLHGPVLCGGGEVLHWHRR